MAGSIACILDLNHGKVSVFDIENMVTLKQYFLFKKVKICICYVFFCSESLAEHRS